MLCQDCKKKPTCKKLCERAEKWVGSDFVSQREIPVPQLTQNLTNYSFSELTYYFSAEKVDFPFLTTLQNKILHMFYFEGFSYSEIARALSGNRGKRKINHNGVDYQIRSAKRQILRFFYTTEKGLMLCKNCGVNKKIKDKPFCSSCWVKFQAWLGVTDYHLNRMEFQRRCEDLQGYEDTQWEEYWM